MSFRRFERRDFLIALAASAVLSVPRSVAAAGRTLRVGRVEAPPSLAVPYSSVGQPASSFWSPMFDGLTSLGADGILGPALALSWKNRSPTEWIFNLRPQTRFHNGAVFDAAAVIGTIEMLQTLPGKAYYVAPEVGDIVSWQTPDPLTLILTTRKPDPILPNRLNTVMIIEPKSWAAIGPQGFARAPIGTGPFRLTGWGRGGNVTSFEAFRESWRPPIGLDRLEFHHIPESTSRLVALQTGQVDVVEGLSAEEIEQLGGSDVRAVIGPRAAVLTLAFRNAGRPRAPISDARVRLALNYAINREEIARILVGGRMNVASQAVTPGVFGYNPALLPFPFDPSKAQALLKEAGFERGLSLVMEVVVSSGLWEAAMYQKIAQDLAAVGVRAKIKTMAFPNFLSKVASGDWGDTDMFSFMLDSSTYGDAARPLSITSCAKPNPFFCEPSVMPSIEAAGVEMDPTKREELLRSIAAQLREIAPAIWLLEFKTFYAARSSVRELPVRPSGIAYEGVTLDG